MLFVSLYLLQGVPGPGQYEIKSQFKKKEYTTQSGNKVAHASFLIQSKVGGRIFFPFKLYWSKIA